MSGSYEDLVPFLSAIGMFSILLGIGFYIYIIIPVLNHIGRRQERDKERSVIYRGIFVRFK